MHLSAILTNQKFSITNLFENFAKKIKSDNNIVVEQQQQLKTNKLNLIQLNNSFLMSNSYPENTNNMDEKFIKIINEILTTENSFVMDLQKVSSTNMIQKIGESFDFEFLNQYLNIPILNDSLKNKSQLTLIYFNCDLIYLNVKKKLG